MPDGAIHFPYFLVNGDQEAREFLRGVYDPSLAAANQYEQGDLVFIDGSDNGYVKKAITVGASLPSLLIAGQDYSIDELLLPPNDGSSPHWFYGRGVPCNKIEEDKHEAVFTLRGGSGGAAADDTSYALTAADIISIQSGAEVDLFHDPTHGCLVVDASATAGPNVQLQRLLHPDAAAGDTDVSVVCQILPGFIRK